MRAPQVLHQVEAISCKPLCATFTSPSGLGATAVDFVQVIQALALESRSTAAGLHPSLQSQSSLQVVLLHCAVVRAQQLPEQRCKPSCPAPELAVLTASAVQYSACEECKQSVAQCTCNSLPLLSSAISCRLARTPDSCKRAPLTGQS